VQLLPHGHGAPPSVDGAAHGRDGSCPAGTASVDVPVVSATSTVNVATGAPSGGHAFETLYDSPVIAPG